MSGQLLGVHCLECKSGLCYSIVEATSHTGEVGVAYAIQPCKTCLAAACKLTCKLVRAEVRPSPGAMLHAGDEDL